MLDRRGVDGWLLSLCTARTFMTFTFMTYAACLPVLRVEWDMSATAAGSISTAFQVGYAVSLMGFSSLADRVGARRVFLLSAVLGAATSLIFALFARSYLSGLLLYTLVALSMGGTYTTAIMLLADRYHAERRGGAVGWLIASASLGYAFSLLVSGLMLPLGGYPLAFLATGAGPVIAVVIAWLALRTTPNVVHPRSQDLRFGTEVLRNPQAMRLIVGYMFHSFEAIGMWSWAPAFVTASLAVSGARGAGAVALGANLSASFHVTGLLASSSMGRLSDRLGRRALLVGLAAISTACSFTFGWLLAWPTAVVVSVGAIYGFAAVGDSPVLSAALTEAVKPAYLGSALALRSLVGFGAGAFAPLAFGVVLDATNRGGGTPTNWGWAFACLGVAGLIATSCACTLKPATPPSTARP
jgi:MFS family permease